MAWLLILAAPSCGGSDGGPGAQFCNEWAAAFCKRIWACDPGNNPFAGPSQGECTKGYAMLCSQPQPAGQTFDPSCAGGKQVNQAAKMSCLNKLNTVSCDEFNGATYDDDCELVCTAGGTGGSGGGGAGGGSGGSSGNSCGSVAPCGGDIVGTWTITGVCVNQPTATDPDCPGYAVSNVSATESGTISYTAAGTYSATFTRTLQYTDTIPATCIDPATCADLPYTYALLGLSAACTGTTVCTCSVAASGTGSETGTYATSGTTLTATDTVSGDIDTMAYCVQGNTVHLLSYNGAGQVTSEQIAQRQ